MASPKTKEVDFEAMFKTLMDNMQKNNEEMKTSLEKTNEESRKNNVEMKTSLEKTNEEIKISQEKNSEQIQQVKEDMKKNNEEIRKDNEETRNILTSKIEKSIIEQTVKIDIKLREHKVELANEVKENLKKFAEQWNEKFNSNKRDQDTHLRLLSEAIQEDAGKTSELEDRTMSLEAASVGQERISTSNHDKITDIESKLQQEIQRLTTEIKRKPTQMVLCSSVTDERYRIKFSGKKFENPMEFCLKCENEMENIGTLLTDKEKLDFVTKHLQGSAEKWFHIVRDEIITYEQFKKAFEGRFWNAHIQRGIRDELEYGKYSYKLNSTFEEYAIQLIERAKHLRPSITQEEFVQKIAHHFNHDIQLAIYTQGTETLEKLFVLLNQSQNLHLNRERTDTRHSNDNTYVRSEPRRNYISWQERRRQEEKNSQYRDKPSGQRYDSAYMTDDEGKRGRDTRYFPRADERARNYCSDGETHRERNTQPKYTREERDSYTQRGREPHSRYAEEKDRNYYSERERDRNTQWRQRGRHKEQGYQRDKHSDNVYWTEDRETQRERAPHPNYAKKKGDYAQHYKSCATTTAKKSNTSSDGRNANGYQPSQGPPNSESTLSQQITSQ